MRRTLAGFAFLLGLAFTPAPAETISRTFTLDELRAIAQQAYRARNYVAARDAALLLLHADPNDPAALVVLAATEPHLGRAKSASAAGLRAWKQADSKALKSEAALFTARAEAFEKRYGRAKIWLRRAYTTAQTPQQKQVVATSYKQVRALSPWTTQLSFSVNPSSNINGGSSSNLLEIEDFPYIGVLSGSAQALPGTVTTAEAQLSYKLSQDRSHLTQVRIGAFHNFHSLPQEARLAAPGLTGGDLNFALVEAGLVHQIKPGTSPLPDYFALSYGKSFFGGAALDHYLRGDVGKIYRLNPKTSAQLRLSLDRRWSDRGAPSTDGRRVEAQLTRAIAGNSALSLTFGLREASSRSMQQDYSGWDAKLGLNLGKPVGPVSLSGSLGFGVRDYQSYRIGFFPVPGGRQDKTATAQLNMQLRDVDYMGFHPVISLQKTQTWSNISRFETDSVGVTLGLRSSF